MKNLLSLALVFFLAIGCSKDDGLDPSTFSFLRVNGESFVPTPNHGEVQNIWTAFSEGSDTEPNHRTFNMIRQAETEQSIYVQVNYPMDQEGIDGDYSLLPDDNLGPRSISAAFMNGSMSIPLTSGAINIVDIGNGRYKLTFNNALGNSGGSETLVTGYFDGAFATYIED